MTARSSDPGTSQGAINPNTERRLKQLVTEAYDVLGPDGGGRSAVKDLTGLELDSISPRHEQLRNDRKLVRTGKEIDGCEVHVHIDHATPEFLRYEAARTESDSAKRIERAKEAVTKAEERAQRDAERAAWLRAKANGTELFDL